MRMQKVAMLGAGVMGGGGGSSRATIALGHPLGAMGAMLTATLLHRLRRTHGRYGMVSMCIGGGMGAAAVFERA